MFPLPQEGFGPSRLLSLMKTGSLQISHGQKSIIENYYEEVAKSPGFEFQSGFESLPSFTFLFITRSHKIIYYVCQLHLSPSVRI